jgi:hypothetical protein
MGANRGSCQRSRHSLEVQAFSASEGARSLAAKRAGPQFRPEESSRRSIFYVGNAPLIAVTRGAVRALADMRIKAVEQRRDERGRELRLEAPVGPSGSLGPAYEHRANDTVPPATATGAATRTPSAFVANRACTE